MNRREAEYSDSGFTFFIHDNRKFVQRTLYCDIDSDVNSLLQFGGLLLVWPAAGGESCTQASCFIYEI